MELLREIVRWLAGEPYLSMDGVPTLIVEHLAYSIVPTAAAVAVTLPIGLWIGHANKGGLVAINVANVGRAVPSFGLIILAFMAFGFGFVPVYITLFALAIPPILTNTYVGVREVDREVRESAEGMGLTGWQILRQVELPLALPVIMSGIRTSAVQVVATATLAAVVGLGGLGRPIINGLSQNVQASASARAIVLVGAAVVALLAVAVELGLGRVERAVTPQGMRPPAERALQHAAQAGRPGGDGSL
ncbi:MAG TPA: ABC transporter permease [Egibacteraceae bacterium]|nr:ABC transporter permease [Egibacteraceae bacterium]